jgi:alpha/beta superfamily hydrolase
MYQPCPPDEVVIESVRFAAGAFCLEGELAYPATGRPVGAVILAGPHPLLGGTRRNNVVACLGDALARRGLATLRFDYRSAGDVTRRLAEFWRNSRVSGEEEYADDLCAAVDFMRRAVGEAPLALVGYSFGCTLLGAVARKHHAQTLVLLAPTVGTHDLGAFEDLPQPRLVIAPRDDFAADEQQLTAWFERLPDPCELLRPSLDGHFFRGREDWLAETVGSFLDRQWERNA